jgi:hypothetical protein
MHSTTACVDAGLPAPRISRIFAWLARSAGRQRRVATLDLAFLPPDRLRDIGLLDGRGGSLRRPERAAFDAYRRR